MRSAWRGASTKWNNQVHKTAWSTCKNRAPLVSHATRSSFDREQSILRTRNRGVLQGATVRLAGRCSVVRQPAILHHDRILVPLLRRFLFSPFLHRSSPQLRVLLLEPLLSNGLPLARDSLRLSPLLSTPLRASSFPFHTERRYTRTLHALQPLHRAFR